MPDCVLSSSCLAPRSPRVFHVRFQPRNFSTNFSTDVFNGRFQQTSSTGVSNGRFQWTFSTDAFNGHFNGRFVWARTTVSGSSRKSSMVQTRVCRRASNTSRPSRCAGVATGIQGSWLPRAVVARDQAQTQRTVFCETPTKTQIDIFHVRYVASTQLVPQILHVTATMYQAVQQSRLFSAIRIYQPFVLMVWIRFCRAFSSFWMVSPPPVSFYFHAHGVR